MPDTPTISVGVKLEGDDINDMLAKAVLESALGEQVRNAVAEAVRQLGNTWVTRDGIQQAIEQTVTIEAQKMARELVASEFADTIRAEVHKRLTAEKVADLVIAAFSRADKSNW